MVIHVSTNYKPFPVRLFSDYDSKCMLKDLKFVVLPPLEICTSFIKQEAMMTCIL